MLCSLLHEGVNLFFFSWVRGGSSRIQRGLVVTWIKKRSFHGNRRRQNATEETRSAQARSRYVCPTVMRAMWALLCQSCGCPHLFWKDQFTVSAFPFPLCGFCIMMRFVTLGYSHRDYWLLSHTTFGGFSFSPSTLSGFWSHFGWLRCCKLSLPIVLNFNVWSCGDF